MGAAATAEAREWGGGYGFGPSLGHARVIVREGYRGIGFRHREWDRPGVRAIERRGYHHDRHHDGDD